MTNNEQSLKDEHYLKKELYDKVQNDPRFFDWLEQGSLDGIWYWDLVDGEQEWLSPKFKSVFGYKNDEIPHTSAWWQENINPDDLETALENFNKHVEDPSHPYDQIVRYRHKDGSTVWIRCRGLIVRDDQDKPIRMLGAHTDVTQLKQAEEALNQKTLELERSNAELEQFAFVASHDLKAPLNAMQKIIRWIEEDCEQILPESAKENFALLKSRSERMAGLLDCLLQFARVGRIEYEAESVNLETLAYNAFELLGHEDTFTLNVQPAMLMIQRFPLEFALNNLFSNAIKHHHQATGTITVTVEQSDNEYRIKVADDGPGISTENHQRAFDMFTTLKPRDKVEGSGMGLALVKKTVNHCGASIHIESDGQSGTTFVICWPIKQPLAVNAEA